MVLRMTDDPPGEARDSAVQKAAANVRSALAWRNISYSAAGRAIGMDPSNMSRRCNGHIPFDAGDLTLLAKLLELTPGHLLDGEPWPEKARKEDAGLSSWPDPDARPAY